MPYYNTLTEDIARAKEILEKGKLRREDFEIVTARGEVQELPPGVAERFIAGSGTIYGADIYAAYKLLESFVEAIEAVDPKVCELAMRHTRRATRP